MLTYSNLNVSTSWVRIHKLKKIYLFLEVFTEIHWSFNSTNTMSVAQGVLVFYNFFGV